MTVLFSRWQQTLDLHAGRPAVVDGAERLSFSALDERLASLPEADGPVIAQGSALEVVLATLRGWRDGRPVLPLEKGAAPPAWPAFPDGTAHVKLTPGISGSPRAVFFSAAQIAADADRLVAAMGLSPEAPNLAAISLTHSYGFSGIVLPLLLHGIPLHAVELPFPKVMADAMSEYPQVTLQAVPSMWRAWHRSGILRGANIRRAVSAGAPLSLELEQAIHEETGLKLHNFYGASECGGISYDATETPRTDAADLGTPLPGVEVTVAGGGRFRIRSTSVAMGYEVTRKGEELGEGFFLTQDHGRLSGNRLVLESSGAESINVAGRKIGPAKIEAALLATGLVERARVYGVPSSDAERVEEIAAMVRFKTDTGDLDQLRQHLSSALAGWEMPRHWETAADDHAWALSRADLKKRALARSA